MAWDFVSTTVIIAGLCALSAVVISIRHIYNHLTHYAAPEYQLHIVRILAMVPIYSLTSWFALVIQDEISVLVLDLIRDSYEAYVIYNFVILLINYGGGHLHLCRYLEDQPRMDHPFPGNLWLPPLKLGPAFLAGIRVSVLQFVFVKPINSVLNFYLHFQSPSSMRTVFFVLIIILNNISVSAALYGLILFYHAADDLLQPHRPFEKFIAVKAVVFFSFWQGFALSLAKSLGYIHDVVGFSADEQTTGIQDVLICVEMSIAAICHVFVFTWGEYERDVQVWTPANKHPLLHVVDFRDVLSDAKDRFYGAVGYENELVEGAPIVPGSVLCDSASPSSSSSSRHPPRYPRPPRFNAAHLKSHSQTTPPTPRQTNTENRQKHSISADLMTMPWAMRSPSSSQLSYDQARPQQPP